MNELDVVKRENMELRERIRFLEDALTPLEFQPPIEWQLTQKEAALYAHLASRSVATKNSIMAAIYSPGVDDEPEIKIVDVFICKMRRKLKPFGITISTVWGVGYSLNRAAEGEAA